MYVAAEFTLPQGQSKLCHYSMVWEIPAVMLTDVAAPSYGANDVGISAAQGAAATHVV